MLKLAIAVLTAFHYSALGNYLVDQDGNEVKPTPGIQVTCTQGKGTLRVSGKLQKSRGATIWIISHIENGGPDWYIEIPKPVCDVE